MKAFGVEDIFNLVGYGIRKRQPVVKGRIPTTEDLIRELNETHAAEVEEKGGMEGQDVYNESEKAKQGLSGGSQSVPEAISQGTACVPCCLDHYSTCAGLVSDEAVRMAKRDGIAGKEIINRILSCRSQLNAMEREDLSADKIANLPEWEKEIAIIAQNEGAEIRHKLSNIKSPEDLEDVAIQIKKDYGEIGERWMNGRMANMSQEEKNKVTERAKDLLGHLEQHGRQIPS